MRFSTTAYLTFMNGRHSHIGNAATSYDDAVLLQVVTYSYINCKLK